MASSRLHFPGGFLALTRRRPARILAVTALFVLCAGGYNAVHGPRYTASMRVLVSPGAATLAFAAPDAATLLVPDHGQAARNLAALLSDPGLVAAMLPPRLEPAPNFPPWGEALGHRIRPFAEQVGLIGAPGADGALDARLVGAFSAAALGDTDVLKLDLTWNDARYAATALDAIAAGTARSVSGAAEARGTLARAEGQMRAAQGEADALDPVGQAADAVGAAPRKAAIEARMAAARASADQMRVALELARRGAASTDGAYRGGGWVGGAESGKLAKGFADLLQQKQALGASPDADAVAAIDGKIAQLRERNYRAVRGRYADEAAGLTAKLALVQAAIDEDEGALRALAASGVQAQLRQEARAAKLAQLGLARARLREAGLRIDAAWQEVGAVRVLSPPRVPSAPDWPSPTWLLRMAALAGFGAGVLSAALAERARRTIDYPADITRLLGIEVLARLAEQPAARPR